jgi:hypothetical protein
MGRVLAPPPPPVVVAPAELRPPVEPVQLGLF